MDNFKYGLRRFKYDILSSVLALLLTWMAFTFFEDPKINLFSSVIVIFIFLMVIIYLRHRNRDFYFISFQKRNDKDNWIGSGRFDYIRSHRCFSITDADPGYIYSPCLNWSNYNFSFNFKILKYGLGVIIRAVNLMNYAMIQLTTEGVRPHIKINGGWALWGHKETDLVFSESLSKDKWYRCTISCENNLITIKLYKGQTEIFNRVWNIPIGSIIFDFRKEEKDPNPVKIPFPIALEYGSVGFRNYGDENALLKNVFVEKL